MLDTGLSWWDNLNASFWNLWHSKKGQQIWDVGIDKWKMDIAYANAQKYLGLALLGYIGYKTFK